ncbi:MAG: hypothetical protein KDD02_24260 [Phaeodactylibacter sp.]|nr:hypothetical protein [Phaeodactylibacter sp.]
MLTRITFMFTMTGLLLGFSSCQKEAYVAPSVQEAPEYKVSLVFKPALSGISPFLFGETYNLNQTAVRIDKISFHLEDNDAGNEVLPVFFDHVHLRQQKAYRLSDPEQDQIDLEFQETLTICQEYWTTTGSGQDQTSTLVTTCNSNTFADLEISLSLDIDGNGIFESSHDIMVDMLPLMLTKQIAFPPYQEEVVLIFHIDKLFTGVDFNELTRLSTQVRIAENLPVSLEQE